MRKSWSYYHCRWEKIWATLNHFRRGSCEYNGPQATKNGGGGALTLQGAAPHSPSWGGLRPSTPSCVPRRAVPAVPAPHVPSSPLSVGATPSSQRGPGRHRWGPCKCAAPRTVPRVSTAPPTWHTCQAPPRPAPWSTHPSSTCHLHHLTHNLYTLQTRPPDTQSPLTCDKTYKSECWKDSNFLKSYTNFVLVIIVIIEIMKIMIVMIMMIIIIIITITTQWYHQAYTHHLKYFRHDIHTYFPYKSPSIPIYTFFGGPTHTHTRMYILTLTDQQTLPSPHK